MSITLNTSHPLYGNILRLVGVDSSNVITEAKGDTLTSDAAVTTGTGTYGRHFTTSASGSNSLGVAMTAGFVTKPLSTSIGTTFIVVNNIAAANNRGHMIDIATVGNNPGPAIYSGKAAINSLTNTPNNLSTTTVLSTGAHSIATGYNGTTSSKTWVDGALEATGGSQGNASNGANKYIGGDPSGGYGSVVASFVWVVEFDKFLSDAEVSSLHSSLGVNTFGLISASTPTATLAWTEANDVTALAATVTISGVAAAMAWTEVNDATSISGTISTPTLTTRIVKNNTGTVLPNQANCAINIYNNTTGALVLHLTGLTTTAAGRLIISNAALTVGTTYAYEIDLSAASLGRRLPTAVVA